jgi:hypothetical protein
MEIVVKGNSSEEYRTANDVLPIDGDIQERE